MSHRLSTRLCPNCSTIDVRALCQPTDENIGDQHIKNGYFRYEKAQVLCFSYSTNVLELKIGASGGCELCDIICTTLGGVPLEEDVTAKTLPIVMFGTGNAQIGVCLDSPNEGLIRLCNLDVSREQMDDFRDLQERPGLDTTPNGSITGHNACRTNLPFEIFQKVHGDPSSKRCMQLASKWLKSCVANHIDCWESDGPVFQSLTRFVNVGNDKRSPYLVEFSPYDKPTVWAALSYCWGSCRKMTLTTSNLNEFQNELAFSSLDATIKDAVIVCRALDIEYLWVDSLCILQDVSKQDWTLQASKMRDIYEQSKVTIVTTNTSSANERFLETRNRKYVLVPWHLDWLSDNATSADTYRVYLSVSWDRTDDKLIGPWSQRGWTFQEELLSKRLLFFSSTQMVWKCCKETVYERGEESVAMHKIRDKFMDEGGRTFWSLDLFTKFKLMPWYLSIFDSDLRRDRHRLWYELVQEYSSRNLSYQSDRLVALSGLAEKYQTMLGDDQYLAGLWKNDIIRGLMWHVSGQKTLDEWTLRCRLGERYNSPSWSWAGLPHGIVIENDHASEPDLKFEAAVIDIRVDNESPPRSFGEISTGVIQLYAPTSYFNKFYNANWKSPSANLSALERHISHVIEHEYGKDASHFAEVGQFAAVSMLKHLVSLHNRRDILLVEVISPANSPTKICRRVGVIKLMHYSFSTSPQVLDSKKRLQGLLEYRLGLRKSPEGVNIISGREVDRELIRQEWTFEKISII